MKNMFNQLLIYALTLFSLVNQHRVSLGKPAFIQDYKLCEYAGIRAEQISRDWSHNIFYNNKYLYIYPQMGENLARYYSSPEAVFNGWINSPSHKYFMERNYKYGCVGFYIKDGNAYYTLEMGNKERVAL